VIHWEIEYGDERRAKRVARAIVRARPLKDTLRLADAVAGAVARSGRIHPATRTFQAIRVYLNREHDHIERGLPAAIRRLRPGGRLVAISFHSGEDRIVKNLLKSEAGEGRVALLTKKPGGPDPEEVRGNPRARSARLRACEKTGEAG
jgi:16S rRNA (cytosine1402-N4)-methyltransferase